MIIELTDEEIDHITCACGHLKILKMLAGVAELPAGARDVLRISFSNLKLIVDRFPAEKIPANMWQILDELESDLGEARAGHERSCRPLAKIDAAPQATDESDQAQMLDPGPAEYIRARKPPSTGGQS